MTVTVWFGAMGIGAICEGTKVSGVRIGTEFGPVEVRATSIIDATGNSDIAAAAGSETEFIGAAEFALQSAGQSPHRLARHGLLFLTPLQVLEVVHLKIASS